MTYGDQDPRIAPAQRAAHQRAVELGRPTYVDPDTGYSVLTAERLRAVGECCGCGCRHCPYPAAEQRAAGRRLVRPDGS